MKSRSREVKGKVGKDLRENWELAIGSASLPDAKELPLIAPVANRRASGLAWRVFRPSSLRLLLRVRTHLCGGGSIGLSGSGSFGLLRLSSRLLFLLQFFSFGVGDVAELLHPSGILLRGKHAIVLVDGKPD